MSLGQCQTSALRAAPGLTAPAGVNVKSDAPALARPAPIMRDWGHVADRRDREADRLQRAEGAFASRPRAADFYLQRLHAVLAGFLAGILGCHLSGIRGAFAAALEAL